jgi:hypothetical protein
MITGMADHDLGELPASVERRMVLVHVPASLLNPFDRWEYQEQDVQVVNLSGSPTLRPGDSLRFTTRMIVES